MTVKHCLIHNICMENHWAS